MKNLRQIAMTIARRRIVGLGLAAMVALWPGAAMAQSGDSGLCLAPDDLVRDDLDSKAAKRVAKVTAPPTDFLNAQGFEAMSGGATTSTAPVSRDAFSHFAPNISFENQETFKLGNALFRKDWVSSPSSTQASDGLGPLFNARACQSCHLKDGRGHPPEASSDATSMFLRLARPATSAEDRAAVDNGTLLNLPDPVYGEQLQDFAVPGLPREGRMVISYSEEPVTLKDGTVVSLRRPSYSVADLGYGPLSPDTTLSPRIAPPMTGLGLIEAIHPADIAALADPDDQNGDGISGRMALIRDKVTGKVAIGRFGWKAQNTNVRAQSAGAFAGDIGISTPDVPHPHGDCTAAETACLAAPTGIQPRLGDSEAPDQVKDLVTYYSQNLAVPVRRDVDAPQVLQGKKLFHDWGCAGCHRPNYVTQKDAVDPAHAFQLIWPYSDFLLHDMGEGLADGQSVGLASGSEWKTPPLWGIGLTEAVSGHQFFLHDGRARSLLEAILWHGGEAATAAARVTDAETAERDALIAFLESL